MTRDQFSIDRRTVLKSISGGVVAAGTVTGVGTASHGDSSTLIVDGGSGDYHFETIQGAVDAADPGDTVEVTGGTYPENVVVSTPDVEVTGSPNDRPTVVGSGDEATHGILVEADGVTLTHLAVDDAGDRGITIAGNDAAVLHTVVRDNGRWGIVVGSRRTQYSNAVVAHNRAWGHSLDDIRVNRELTDSQISHNYARAGRRRWGIFVLGRNNTIQHNDVDALATNSNSANNLVQHNVNVGQCSNSGTNNVWFKNDTSECDTRRPGP